MTKRRRIVVVLNAGSGGGCDEAFAARLAALFRAAGADAEVRLARNGSEIGVAVAAAIAERPDAIVAGGGDGTVSAIGGALVDSEISFGILPLGTLNHFAKDMGLSLDLDAAVGHIVHGQPRRVDVGEVNGRIFINNASLGLYPDMVRHREQQQKRFGRGKWSAMLWASVGALRRYPFLGVRLSVDGREMLCRTPFVFIGNNEYSMEGFSAGKRKGLGGGLLSLYVARRPGRLRLLQLAARALVGRLRQARDFDALHASRIVVESRRRRLHVATDGEVRIMTPPLCFRIRPASLAVLRDDSVSASA